MSSPLQSSASSLFDMLSTLASDSDKLSDFWDDPEGEMEHTYGLEKEQIDLIMEAINTGSDDFLAAVASEASAMFSEGKPDAKFIC